MFSVNNKKPYSKDWEEDCMHYWGKVLTGKYAHWCYDWDGLPVDETCEEFKACCCYPVQRRKNYLTWVFLFLIIVVVSYAMSTLKCNNVSRQHQVQGMRK